MKKTYRLEQTQFIPKARGEVFPFFADASNLERVTPAFLHFRILTPHPIPMKPGALIDYELQLYGISMHWRTCIEIFEPPSSFTDIQLSGPYRRWRHSARCPGASARGAATRAPLRSSARSPRLFIMLNSAPPVLN
jgi:ligand-binding SRPBCC domain-containing protein